MDAKKNNSSNEEWLHYQAAHDLTEILQKHGYEAYVVGGAVRDMVLGRHPKDFDISTNATPEQVLKLPELKKSFYKDPAQAYGVTRVKIPVKTDGEVYEIETEIATFRKDIEAHRGRKETTVEFTHLRDDLQRRDLTINALALNLHTQQIIDYTGGLRDIHERQIRFIGRAKDRIHEDPLRLLRAIRIKNQLGGFIYAKETKEALQQAVAHGYVEKIAIERLQSELTRIIRHPNRAQAIVDLDDFGIIERILPEVNSLKGVPQPKNHHGEGDVFRHTLLALSCLPEKPSARLAWATLLHDSGKAETVKPPNHETDRIHFYNHHEVSTHHAEEVLKRLRFSKKMIEDVKWLVHYHMTIGELDQIKPTRRNQFMSHPCFLDLRELHRADICGSWSTQPDGSLDRSEPDMAHVDSYWKEFKQKQQEKPPSLKDDLGIDGDWLKQEFQLEDGPELGRLLDNLNEAYLDHDVTSKESARTYVEKILKNK